ncbi:cyclin [Ophiocordyceps camponoti-floridani]|uniref:RNA polymerase II holoenzyme cyclin-like subunit n=1 Tax=Ophiocordyceps camponoti-floridani TaxID=2030778 RepID=A0A8H4QBS5_9HYPO|nr:cyclin [Ophiocordyceps camponoti-floridani]
MASIDRYRPPREGYQPPSLPGATRNDQASRSPPRRREVPPAAPTPPQHSARTSPPRSGTQPGQQSPSPSARRGYQWSFTPEEVSSSPSIIHGMPPAEERLRRAKGVNFIYQAGVVLDLPQITLWVAGVFFHRFFMRKSMVEEMGGVHHYNIAATALFLANKVEENCRKTKDIIIAVVKVAQKNAKLVIDEQSKEYWRWRDSILMYEESMLEHLTFDLMIDNPYRHLFELLGQLDIVHNKHLRQAAWAFCNDACLTALPLLIEARDVAISAIFFASVHTGQQVDDIHGEPWWKYLNGDEERCTRAIEVMRQFYTENPLRKQNPSLPSPPYDLENTRRRADALLSQPEALSSAGGTPMIDRASRSPAPPKTNGTDRGSETKEQEAKTAPTARGAEGADAVPSSTPKRREATDADTGSSQERPEKRTRLSEDEGEVEE